MKLFGTSDDFTAIVVSPYITKIWRIWIPNCRPDSHSVLAFASTFMSEGLHVFVLNVLSSFGKQLETRWNNYLNSSSTLTIVFFKGRSILFSLQMCKLTDSPAKTSPTPLPSSAECSERQMFQTPSTIKMKNVKKYVSTDGFFHQATKVLTSSSGDSHYFRFSFINCSNKTNQSGMFWGIFNPEVERF